MALQEAYLVGLFEDTLSSNIKNELHVLSPVQNRIKQHPRTETVYYMKSLIKFKGKSGCVKEKKITQSLLKGFTEAPPPTCILSGG